MEIDINKEEVGQIVNMMEGSTVQLVHAEKAIILLKKFKEKME